MPYNKHFQMATVLKLILYSSNTEMPEKHLLNVSSKIILHCKSLSQQSYVVLELVLNTCSSNTEMSEKHLLNVSSTCEILGYLIKSRHLCRRGIKFSSFRSSVCTFVC